MVARTQPNNSPLTEPAYSDALADDITGQLSALAVRITRELVRGREYALCITKLEEAMFWLQRGKATQHAVQAQTPTDG